MNPYFDDDGNRYERVTEVIGAGDCEATAFNEKSTARRKMVRNSHIVTLPGTLVHAKIQQQLEAVMGKPSKGIYLEGPAKKLYGKIYIQHMKQRKKDTNCQTTYSDIQEKVNDCFANYLAFVVDNPFTPLLVEQRMISKIYKTGGTVDLVGLFNVRGHAIVSTPDVKNLPTKQYFKRCDHTTKCDCTTEEVVVVADWKTSTRKQDGHRIQMSAYLCMLEELGTLDHYRKKGYNICWETMSLLLGVHGYKKYKTPYQIHWYEPLVEDFLVRRGVHQNARNMSINVKGKTGLKGRCMFCSHILNCPDRLMWNLNGEIEFNTSFTRAELANMELLASSTKGGHFKELRDKIEEYIAHARIQEEEIEEVLPTVIGDIEHELDILTAKAKISEE